MKLKLKNSINIYQMFFKMEAKGVTPIPQPTKIAISFLKTSSAGAPKGPSIRSNGKSFGIAPFSLLQPSASPNSLVKSPT